MFGAFVVANRNDSDSDRTADSQDSSVVGNGRAAEPDLIELVITIPEWGPHYECSVQAFQTNFVTNSTTSTESVRFFGSKTKGSLVQAGITPWPGSPVNILNPTYRPADGFNITQAGVYTVYAEVHGASKHICDYDIIVELRTPESTTSNGQFDQVNVTAIWAETHEVITEQPEHEILLAGDWSGGKVIYHTLPVPQGAATPTLPAGIEVGDYIVVYDDNWTSLEGGEWEHTGYRWEELYPIQSNQNDPLWESNEQTQKRRLGRQWVVAKIVSQQTDGGLRVSLPLPQDNYHGTSQIITKYDRFAYFLNKNVDLESEVLFAFCINGGRLGSSRPGKHRPTSGNGIEFQFSVSPPKVFERPMSQGDYIQTDTARQMHGGGLMEQAQTKHSIKQYPPVTEDEQPNDAGVNGDIDFVVPRTNSVITVVDAPKAEGIVETNNQEHRFGMVSFTFAGNPDYLRLDVEAKEFLRICFTEPPVTYENPGDIVWGSRASNKVLWYSKHSCEPDVQRPTGYSLGGAPMFYAQDREMFVNEIGIGAYPYTIFFDAVWPGRHPH